MKRVLIDCDPGIDDALALLLALGSDTRIDVRAIVATFGNVALDKTKKNLLRLLNFFDKRPLIGSGSKGPIKGSAPEARYVHGRDGLADLPSSFWRKVESGKRIKPALKDGIGLIINSVLSKKIDKVIATGPLTDLARAIKKNRFFLSNLDEIVIMGGAVFTKGNVTPYSEFNFYCDPEAAKVVLNAGVKKRIVSLDVTQKTLLTEARVKPLKKIDTVLAKFISGIVQYSMRLNKNRGFSGAPMHDPLAVALTIDEGMGEYESICLDVKTKGAAKGKVVLKKGSPNVRFCKKVDTERFFKLFIGSLLKLADPI